MCTRTLSIVYLCIIYYVQCHNESAILFDIYQSTNGEYWFIKWNVSTIYRNPCDALLWGITCLSNHIVQIHLPSNNLTGSLPNSITNLHYLSDVNMSYNQLHGAIPAPLFAMNSIHIITLSHNQLSSSISIPNNTGNKLTQIHLNHNALSGSIPSNIDIFTNLTVLSLNNNLFTSIPSNIFTLHHLRILKLQNNALSQSMPPNLNQTNIEYAYFHNNHLHGIIPLLPSSIIGITLHNNDFTFNEDDNYFLQDFLHNLNSKPYLNAITIYNNRNLYGELVSFNTSTLKIFMSHSCQIAQTLPSSTYFIPTHISLINNRLSSTIPSDFITPYTTESAMLQIALFGQGNKFKFDIGWHGLGVDNPLWIKNSILNTNSAQLFYTTQLKILEVFIILIVFGIVLFLIIYNIHRMHKEKIKKKDPRAYMELKKNDPLYSIVHSQPYSFFSQLKDIARYLYVAPALLFAVLTSILYYSSSNKYYYNADFLLKWSIIYIGSATPRYNSPETVSLMDNISQWIASIYVVVYVAFTLYLYYIFYYRFTFPILFYQKIQVTNSRLSYERPKSGKSSQMMVQSLSDENDINHVHDDGFYYTLSGKRKKKSRSQKQRTSAVGSLITRVRSADEYYQFDDNQQTKLFDSGSQILIPSNLDKTRKKSCYDSFDADDDLSISLNQTSERDHSIIFSDSSDDYPMVTNGKKESLLRKSQQMTIGTDRTSYANPKESEYWSDIEIENINNYKKSTQMEDKLTMDKYKNSNMNWCLRHKRKLKRTFKTIWWSMLFIVCEFIIIFYFGTISVANDNMLHMDFNGSVYSILRYCVWIVIAVCNSFIIPRVSKKMVKKLYWICFEWNRQQKLRAITITSDIIRSLNLVWIPMLLLFVMHNDCGRYSNYYWTKCRDTSYSKQFVFHIGDELIDIKSSICSYGFFNDDYDVDYGKCFRSMLEEWGIIIIFSSFGYIVCMIAFWVYSVGRYYYKLRKQYLLEIRKLGSVINVEYAEVWNHVQIVVIFGCCLPFVIPMMAFLLLVNKWVYSSLLSFNFRLSDVNPYFPAQLLIITNALQQTIIILFMWSNQIQGRYFVTVGDIIIDVAFLIWWFWYRNTVMIKKKEIISTHKLSSHK